MYTHNDGGYYLGNWLNDKQHGQGTFTFNDGTIQKGLFKKDKFKGN